MVSKTINTRTCFRGCSLGKCQKLHHVRQCLLACRRRHVQHVRVLYSWIALSVAASHSLGRMNALPSPAGPLR
ncbi:hypothetical protein T440DRAFT_297452 [Plenodomus tracheiphilus IPT5]|uniref:Uncharacterized protein n=1 Tax=Plenodomus tracheiphilus IPT5 TaxID=1408161 RepID=A0A6A7ARK2_9PLEO|nr:hypothetical protein T440DRAFT_297452 [Plenodomus tracheiphilus IPT5]